MTRQRPSAIWFVNVPNTIMRNVQILHQRSVPSLIDPVRIRRSSLQIDDTLSKFEFILPRLQRSQSEPCLIRTPQDDLLGLAVHFGVPKTPISMHRRFNAEISWETQSTIFSQEDEQNSRCSLSTVHRVCSIGHIDTFLSFVSMLSILLSSCLLFWVLSTELISFNYFMSVLVRTQASYFDSEWTFSDE